MSSDFAGWMRIIGESMPECLMMRSRYNHLKNDPLGNKIKVGTFLCAEFMAFKIMVPPV